MPAGSALLQRHAPRLERKCAAAGQPDHRALDIGAIILSECGVERRPGPGIQRPVYNSAFYYGDKRSNGDEDEQRAAEQNPSAQAPGTARPRRVHDDRVVSLSRGQSVQRDDVFPAKVHSFAADVTHRRERPDLIAPLHAFHRARYHFSDGRIFHSPHLDHNS